jgi:hypothetical protein
MGPIYIQGKQDPSNFFQIKLNTENIKKQNKKNRWSENQILEMSEPRNPPSGLRISMTEPIRSFLLSASKDGDVPRELQDLALNLSSQNNLHYKSFRSIWIRSPPSTRPPDLIRLFSGSNFILSSPKPREKVIVIKEKHSISLFTRLFWLFIFLIWLLLLLLLLL